MNEDRTDIQAGRTVSGIQLGESVPPWERPGSFRLDCAPHHGTLLRWMGFASLFIPVLSLTVVCLCLCDSRMGFIAVFFSLATLLVGLPLGLVTALLARSDLAKIRKGLMDPSGQWWTSEARSASRIGLIFSIVMMVGWGLVFLSAFLMRV